MYILNGNGSALQLYYANGYLERKQELGEAGLEAEMFILLRKAYKILICVIHFASGNKRN